MLTLIKTEERILETAEKLFAEFGVIRVRVEDICERLGISKKTFYKCFQSKEGLTSRLSEKILTTTINKILEVVGDDSDVVEETSNIFDILIQSFRQFSVIFYNDIRTQYPDIFAQYERVQVEIINDIMKVNISRGISLGVYNKILDPGLIAQWWFEILWLAYVSKYPPGQVKVMFINGLIKK